MPHSFAFMSQWTLAFNGTVYGVIALPDRSTLVSSRTPWFLASLARWSGISTAGAESGALVETTNGVASAMRSTSSSRVRPCSTKKSVTSPLSGRFGIWRMNTAGGGSPRESRPATFCAPRWPA